MCPPNLKAVTIAIPKKWTKFQNLTVSQGNLDYDPFDILCAAYLLLLAVFLQAKFGAYSFSRRFFLTKDTRRGS